MDWKKYGFSPSGMMMRLNIRRRERTIRNVVSTKDMYKNKCGQSSNHLGLYESRIKVFFGMEVKRVAISSRRL